MRRSTIEAGRAQILAGIERIEPRHLLAAFLEIESTRHYQQRAQRLAIRRLEEARTFIDLGSAPDTAKALNRKLATLIKDVKANGPLQISPDELFAYVARKVMGGLADERAKGLAHALAHRWALIEMKAEGGRRAPEIQFVTAMLAATQSPQARTPLSVVALSKLLLSVGLKAALVNQRSLNARLARMRRDGFRQRGAKRGPARRVEAAGAARLFARLPPGLARIFGVKTGSHLLQLLLRELL